MRSTGDVRAKHGEGELARAEAALRRVLGDRDADARRQWEIASVRRWLDFRLGLDRYRALRRERLKTGG